MGRKPFDGRLACRVRITVKSRRVHNNVSQCHPPGTRCAETGALIGKQQMAVTNIVAVVTAIVAVGGLWLGYLELVKQGSSKRADQFLQMRERLREDQEFSDICQYLELRDPRLREVPLITRDRFIGFFEELTLLWNSKVFNDEVVYYMFGYYALLCWRSNDFWHDLNREQVLWSHYREMVQRLQNIEEAYEPTRRRFRV